MTRIISRPPIREELTEATIQKRLNHFFASHKFYADGLYVFEWESDKLIWTKAGYIYEFEIKISRADFKNDFKHKADKHAILQGPTAEEQMMPCFYEHYERYNHKRYATVGDYRATLSPNSMEFRANHRRPNYFYYAVPTGLIEPDEVPPYAGLIYIDAEYRYIAQSFRIVREAPRLHREKYTDAQLNLGEKFYYNWATARRNHRELAKLYDDVQKRLQRELDRQGHDRTWESLEQELQFKSEQLDHYRTLYYQYEHDADIDHQEIRLLRRELRKLQPDFDYKTIEAEAERYRGKRQNKAE